MISKEIHQSHNTTEQFFRLLDLAAISLAFLIAMLLYEIQATPLYILTLTLGIIAYLISAEFIGIYRIERGHALKKNKGIVLLSWISSIVILLAIGYLSKTTGELSRVVLGLWFLITPILLFTWRFIACRLKISRLRHGKNIKRVAILGTNKMGTNIAKYITSNENEWLGYNFIGYFEDRVEENERIEHDLSDNIIGDFNDAIDHAKNRHIDILYIVLPMSAEKRISELIEKLSDTAVAVHIVPNFFIYNLLHARWHSIGDYNALSIYDTPFYGAGSLVKKAEDMIVASMILLLISIPMLLITFAIKLTSPGPAIFEQKRYGIGGKELVIKKFRTMTVCENDEDIIKQAEKNDSRITKLGAFLRKTSLDELPQFLNVLDGSMSVVGPRPHAVAHNELYRQEIDGYMLRHMVKPGITGWAQINGFRGETKELQLMKKRIEYDLNYIRNWSLSWDIKIIFLTIFKGFMNKNAY